MIDSCIYPASWSENLKKRKKVGIAETVQFVTKPQLAQQMLQSALDTEMRPAWFVADEVYGSNGSFWWWLEKTAKQPYVLTVNKKQATIIGWQQHKPSEEG